MKDVTEKKQTKVRASPILFIVVSAVMAIPSIFLGIIMILYEYGVGFTVAGVATITLLGIGVPLLCVFVAWHPLAVVSHEGVTIPSLWGKCKSFIAWENVRKIIIVEKDERGIVGVFARNPKNIIWADGRSKDAAKKMLTDLVEVPEFLIDPALSRARVKKS